jgi:hypothetical protein
VRHSGLCDITVRKRSTSQSEESPNEALSYSNALRVRRQLLARIERVVVLILEIACEQAIVRSHIATAIAEDIVDVLDGSDMQSGASFEFSSAFGEADSDTDLARRARAIFLPEEASESVRWCPRSESNRHAFNGGGF